MEDKLVSEYQVLEEIAAPEKIERKKIICQQFLVWKRIKEDKRGDVLKCLHWTSLFKFGLCILKEAKKDHPPDKHGRNSKDRLQWQRLLQDKFKDLIPVPKVFEYIEDNGNTYLAMEYLRGSTMDLELEKNSKALFHSFRNGGEVGTKFIDFAIQITGIIQKLHKAGYIHRDITPANFMIRKDGKVFVIDMELSYSINNNFPNPPFQLGTYGYMSMEQQACKTPTISEDIYALGALLLRLFSGIEPIKLITTNYERNLEKFSDFIENKEIVQMIAKCLHKQPDIRPNLEEVQTTLSNYRSLINEHKLKASINSTLSYSEQAISETIQEALNALSSDYMADENGWYTDGIKQENVPSNPIIKAYYKGLQQGSAGIIYTLGQASNEGYATKIHEQNISKAIDLFKTSNENTSPELGVGLFDGAHGISVCLVKAVEAGLILPTSEIRSLINQLLNYNTPSIDIQRGQAGKGLAFLKCESYMKGDIFKQRLNDCVNDIMKEQYHVWYSYSKSIYKKTHKKVSFAGGASGVTYFLMQYGQQFQNSQSLDKALRILDWLSRSYQIKSGASWSSDLKTPNNQWLYNGVPGIAMTFMKAFAITGFDQYKLWAYQALRYHPTNIIYNNLSQGYGLSGLGEVYIEAFNLFQDQEWMDRARWLVQVIMHQRKWQKDVGCYWFVQRRSHPTPEFMTGNSGVIHFLLRYNSHQKLAYPIFI